MRVTEFILTEKPRIVADWEELVRTLLPAAEAIDVRALREDAEAVLEAIAGERDVPRRKLRAGRGFTLVQVIAEFRALRASVFRLFLPPQATLEELAWFDDALDRALEASTTALAHRADDSLELMLGLLGHELGNPLGAIISLAGRVVAADQPSGPHGQTASQILQSALRMKQLISDLSDFARDRLGDGIVIVRAPADLTETCQQAIDELTALRSGAEVQLETIGSLRGSWDSQRLGQAISSLIADALEQGAGGTVTVIARGEGDAVSLSVHRPGPLIAGSELFVPFRHFDEEVSLSATGLRLGLGLFLARQIIANHGGTLELESSEEFGTTLTARLPRSADPSRALPKEEPPPPLVSSAVALGGGQGPIRRLPR